MQVFYKYRILIGLSALLGQAFLFGMEFTTSKNLVDDVFVNEYTIVLPPESHLDEDYTIHRRDTLKSGTLNFRRNRMLYLKENISIVF